MKSRVKIRSHTCDCVWTGGTGRRSSMVAAESEVNRRLTPTRRHGSTIEGVSKAVHIYLMRMPTHCTILRMGTCVIVERHLHWKACLSRPILTTDGIRTGKFIGCQSNRFCYGCSRPVGISNAVEMRIYHNGLVDILGRSCFEAGCSR
jgi:hypothetical protein